MWVFTTTGFVSAVQDWTDTGMLIVRARDAESLRSLTTATGAKLQRTPAADYPYRLNVARSSFAAWVHDQAQRIDYPNFKSEVEAVKGPDFAHALMEVWSVMHDVEDTYARGSAPTVVDPRPTPDGGHNPLRPVVHPEVATRLRRPAPADCGVIRGSLPVISFGSATRAHVATLSLNPSDQEFLDKAGNWLTGKKKRLESLVSLDVSDPRDLTDDQIAAVVERCDRYFEGPWFGPWFGHLDRLMAAAHVDGYKSGNACHLDLVQWATHPTASSLPPQAWQTLLDDDLGFLTWQLSTTPVDVILINGAGPLAGVNASGVVDGFTDDVVPFTRSNGPGAFKVAHAVAGNVLYLAWNLALDKGVSADGVEKLARWVHDRIDEHDPDAFGSVPA